MHETMTFVIGQLDFVSYQFVFGAFAAWTQEVFWTTKCRYIHTQHM